MSDVNTDQDVDDIDHEATARTMGWRPQEEFRGKEKDWVDAATYVRRGQEIKSHTKRENDELKREIARLKATEAETAKTIEEIREYHAGMEKRAIETAMKQLKAQRRAAVVAGDTELAATIDDDIEELKNAPSAVPAKKDPAPEKKVDVDAEGAAIVKKFYDDNSFWYNKDPDNEDMVAFCNGLSGIIGNRTDLSVQEKADELLARVKKRFPDRFGEPKSRVSVTPGGGEGNGRSGSKRGSKSVNALPADARAAGERYVKQKLYASLDAYAEEYFKQPGA